jgi:hypothetical protein
MSEHPVKLKQFYSWYERQTVSENVFDTLKQGSPKLFFCCCRIFILEGQPNQKEANSLESYVLLNCLFFQAGYVIKYIYVSVNSYKQQQKWYSATLNVFKNRRQLQSAIRVSRI